MAAASRRTPVPEERIVDQPVVAARGIRKSYASGTTTATVLDGIDLDIHAGEMVFLVGPSGSGKSTLLSILGCILSPDHGDLRIAGREVTHLSPRDQARFRRVHLGFVFQRFHLFSGLTAVENVSLPLQLLHWERSAALAESQRLLTVVGLEGKFDSRMNRLSMGQRQRVAVARAVAGNPDVILADEPTASLDSTSGKATVELLQTLAREQGKAVIVVTHDSRILHYADRILHLRDGKISGDEVGDDALRPGGKR